MVEERYADKAWLLWVLWVLANTVGALLGFGILILGILVAPFLIDGVNEDRLGGAAMWPVLAITITISQWLVIRTHVARARYWILVTLTGWALGFLLLLTMGRMFPSGPTLVMRAIQFSFLGLCIGAMQWLFLRSRFADSWGWILVNALGFLLYSVAIGKSNTNIVEIAEIGFVPSALTGVLLAFLLAGARRRGETTAA